MTPPAGGAEGPAADPLSVLARIRTTRPRERPRPGERCDLCATPIPDEHEHIVDLEQRNLLCTCHGCFLLLAPRRRGRAALPRRARPLPVVPRLRALAGAVGQPADPGERRLLLRELEPRAGRRLLPEPGRRDGVAAAPRHVGRHRGGPPRPGDAPARRRGLPRALGAPGRRDGGVLPRAHRRLLRDGRAAPAPVAGLRRRAGGARRPRCVLRPDPGPCPSRSGRGSAGRELALVRGARRSGRAARRGADPRAAPPARRGRRPAGPRGRAALPDHDRTAEAALRAGGAGPPGRAVRRDAAVGRDAPAVPVDARRARSSTGFDATTEVDLPITCTYDFEVAAAKYLHGLDGGEIPILLLFSGTIFRAPGDRRHGGLARSRGTRRRPTACRSRSGAT